MRKTYWLRPQTGISRLRWWVVIHFMPWRRLPVHYGSPPAEGDDVCQRCGRPKSDHATVVAPGPMVHVVCPSPVGSAWLSPSEAVAAGKCPSCLGEGWVTRFAPVEHDGPCSTCHGTGLWPSPAGGDDEGEVEDRQRRLRRSRAEFLTRWEQDE